LDRQRIRPEKFNVDHFGDSLPDIESTLESNLDFGLLMRYRSANFLVERSSLHGPYSFE
jgi:hypothetical protein